MTRPATPRRCGCASCSTTFKNLVWTAASLAAFQLEEVLDVTKGAQWLDVLEGHLQAFSDPTEVNEAGDTQRRSELGAAVGRLFGVFPRGVLLAAVIVGGAASWMIARSLVWPDLLDPQWRTRGQLAWTLEAGKPFVLCLVGCFVAAGVARLLTSRSKGS